MKSYGHIHIIASGEHNHDTVPQGINEFKMDKAYIIVDRAVYEKPESNDHYPGIIESIEKVKEMLKTTRKQFELKEIDRISLNTVRNAVLDIVNENKDAKLYFNVSGGTKVLSNGLFLMAIWLDGIVYFVGEDKKLQILTIPKVPVEEIKRNENFITILDIMSKTKRKEILRKDLFIALKSDYKPIREKDKAAKKELAQGTLTKYIDELNSWGLVTIENPEGNKKDKLYKLTDDGFFTLKFIRATKK